MVEKGDFNVTRSQIKANMDGYQDMQCEISVSN